MRVVILGNTMMGYSWFVRTYSQGLELNGCDVHHIDYKTSTLHALKSKLLSIKANYCFTHLTFHKVFPVSLVLDLFRDVNRKVGTKFIHQCHDARTEDRYMDSVEGAYYAAFVGNHILRDNCEKAWKIPVYFSPYSSLTYDKMAEPASDLTFKEAVFTGSPTAHQDRWSFLGRLSKKIPVRIFHTQSKEDLRNRTPELSVSAKCILGMCTGYSIPYYIDVRPFQYLGTGACMIMRKFHRMDEIIPPDLYFPIESYSDEDVDKTVEYYNKILKINTIDMQQKAFKFIQQNHSSKVRMSSVLESLRGSA